MSAQLATIDRSQTMTAARQIGLTPQSIDEALRMAEIMSKASIVPKDFQGNPGNILVAIQWGAELGLPPLQAMQSIAVINGRPAIWGDAVIALVRGSGLLERIEETVSETSATCTVQRRGEAPTARTFSMDDAKRAGLSGKQGPWTQYPKRMMQMRARAWALRDVFPDVLRGVHVAEEAEDMPVERVVTAGPAPALPANSTRTESVKAKLAAKRKQPSGPAPDIDDVMSAIASAEDLAALKQTAAMASKLVSDTDKTAARDAYAARKAALTAAAESPSLELSEPTPLDQILDGIARSPVDDLDIWLDEARVQKIDAAGMVRIEAAIAARKA